LAVNLSEHFWLHEFTSSETAARLGREIVPTSEQLKQLTRLCVEVLEPIRVRLNRPIVITSGLRPFWLNEAIGGSKTSAHMYGRAADVKAVGMSAATFAGWIKRNADDLPIDQVICEFGQWVHIGIADKPRGQYMTARNVNGKTEYIEGIHA
jgi:hypothetical protein